MRKLLITTLTLAICLFLAAGQSAAETGTMEVSAVVSAACNLTVGSLNFGTYDGTTATATTTVTAQCTAGTAYTLSYDAGQNWDGIGMRRMSDGSEPAANYINYSLFCGTGPGVDPEIGGTRCGAGDPIGIIPAGTADGSGQVFEVLGVTYGPESPAAGNYSDNVLVTLTVN